MLAATGTDLPQHLPRTLAGRFRLLDVVGQGNLALVVRAQESHAGRSVALKILHDNLRQNAELVGRFRCEVAVTGKIIHPNVVRVEEVLESDGLLFLVMPFVPGGDLLTFIEERGPLGEADLLCLARQLCSALDAAHTAGVIHRDIKPQNILVSEGADGLKFMLADFGLARTFEASGFTTALSVLGTPAYMAPEVVLHGRADQRSDVYSLGVVLYEAATGRSPFVGDSPYSLFHQQVSAKVEPLRSHGVVISAAFESAILRALEKDPLDRFSGAEAMAAALLAEPANAVSVALAEAKAQLQATECSSCGEPWLRDVGVCAACGHEALGVGPKGPWTLMVTSPGVAGRPLSSREHMRLGRAIEQIALATVIRRPRSIARWPVVVATRLDDHDADVAERAFREAGFIVERTRRRPSFTGAGRALMKKRWLTLGLPMLMVGTQSMTLMPFSSIGLRLALGCLTPLAAGYAWAAWALRPRLKRSKKMPQAHLISLARKLAALERVEERQTAARLLQIAAWLERYGHDDLSKLVACRAESIAHALLALDEADLALADLPSADGDALAALREGERVRVVAVADWLTLLRVAEEAVVRLLAAQSKTSADAQLLDELRRSLDETQLHLQARSDVAAVVGAGGV